MMIKAEANIEHEVMKDQKDSIKVKRDVFVAAMPAIGKMNVGQVKGLSVNSDNVKCSRQCEDTKEEEDQTVEKEDIRLDIVPIQETDILEEANHEVAHEEDTTTGTVIALCGVEALVGNEKCTSKSN